MAQNPLEALAGEINNNRLLIGAINENIKETSKAMNKIYSEFSQKYFKSVEDGYNTLSNITISGEPLIQGYPTQLVEHLEKAQYLNPARKDNPNIISDNVENYFYTGLHAQHITGKEVEDKTPVGLVAHPSPLDATSVGYVLTPLAKLVEGAYNKLKQYSKPIKVDLDEVKALVDRPLPNIEELIQMGKPQAEPLKQFKDDNGFVDINRLTKALVKRFTKTDKEPLKDYKKTDGFSDVEKLTKELVKKYETKDNSIEDYCSKLQGQRITYPNGITVVLENIGNPNVEVNPTIEAKGGNQTIGDIDNSSKFGGYIDKLESIGNHVDRLEKILEGQKKTTSRRTNKSTANRTTTTKKRTVKKKTTKPNTEDILKGILVEQDRNGTHYNNSIEYDINVTLQDGPEGPIEVIPLQPFGYGKDNKTKDYIV